MFLQLAALAVIASAALGSHHRYLQTAYLHRNYPGGIPQLPNCEKFDYDYCTVIPGNLENTELCVDFPGLRRLETFQNKCQYFDFVCKNLGSETAWRILHIGACTAYDQPSNNRNRKFINQLQRLSKTPIHQYFLTKPNLFLDSSKSSMNFLIKPTRQGGVANIEEIERHWMKPKTKITKAELRRIQNMLISMRQNNPNFVETTTHLMNPEPEIKTPMTVPRRIMNILISMRQRNSNIVETTPWMQPESEIKRPMIIPRRLINKIRMMQQKRTYGQGPESITQIRRSDVLD